MHQKGLTLVFRGAFLVDGEGGPASRTPILPRLEDVVAMASSNTGRVRRGGVTQTNEARGKPGRTDRSTRPHHCDTAYVRLPVHRCTACASIALLTGLVM